MIFDVYLDFYSYQSGICQRTGDDLAGSLGLLLVGFSDAGQYWIAKNQWDTWWGEEGYFRLSYADTDLLSFAYAVAVR